METLNRLHHITGKDRLNIQAIMFGLFTAISVVADWYLNAFFFRRPLDEGERYRLETFLEHPRRVLLPPDLTPDGILLLLGFAATYFFLGYLVVKQMVPEITSRWGNRKLSLADAVSISITVGMAFRFGPELFSGLYLLPTVMKLICIILCFYLIFQCSSLALIILQRFSKLCRFSKI
jgi:hypothetical protein